MTKRKQKTYHDGREHSSQMYDGKSKYLTMWLKRWRGVVAYFSTKNDKTNRGNSVFDLFVRMFVFVLCV